MIERKSGSETWKSIGNVPFDTTQYHDAGIQAGVSYTYRVMAMPKSGGHDEQNGAFSNEVVFTAPTDAGAAGTAGSAAHEAHHSYRRTDLGCQPAVALSFGSA
ncbi:MAG TPA: fibronectin type III domain-containing protein [Polyangiales bacterium]|nr:fibronectin type III domain-containing protein [Polyangiales bacterium]